jgi:hypothetical protein
MFGMVLPFKAVATLADAPYFAESWLPRLGRSGSKSYQPLREATVIDPALVLQDGYFAVDR